MACNQVEWIASTCTCREYGLLEHYTVHIIKNRYFVLEQITYQGTIMDMTEHTSITEHLKWFIEQNKEIDFNHSTEWYHSTISLLIYFPCAIRANTELPCQKRHILLSLIWFFQGSTGKVNDIKTLAINHNRVILDR